MTKHGAPDWSKYRTTAPSYPLEDMGELAVRLGAIAVFDRRGEVTLVESFDHGIRDWTITSTPAGGTVTLSPTLTRHGPYALKATTPGSGANQICLLHREPPIYSGRIGVEFAVYLDSSIAAISAQFDYYDGSRHYRITDALAASDLISGGFNILKAVVDLDTKFAVRRILNGTETDTSTAPFTDIAATTDTYLEVTVCTVGNPGAAGVLYVDALVITRDEP
jgi:hypothetical protein